MLAAVGQFCATSSVALNRQICNGLASKAALLGAKMLFLPEASDFISESKEQTFALTTHLPDSAFLGDMKLAAKKNNIWLSVGVHEKTKLPDKIYNTHVIIDASGEIVAEYRKIHLFDVDIKNGPRLMESETTLKGPILGEVVSSPLGNIGLQTCYDLRFAEQSIAQRQRGAEILTFPSAFTLKTGEAHWEILLRARAIETQTFVIAAAQVGQHNPKRASYGHAMIVDPWGTILAQCENSGEPTVAIAPIDLAFLQTQRAQMPVMSHRRNDIYPAL
ncbi:nitrilase [Phycomyces nitens]|nr:nitrilase [Phycomyces nitens]